jgi:glutamate/tyrosine decarboxylase-like PLP-dependent enzyme
MWAAASPALRRLVAGIGLADSWATDGHKWLNVPYDSGMAFCAQWRDAVDWTPEFSRRGRAVPVYAALKSLGRAGVAQIVDRCCAHARRFAEELGADPRVEVLNEVVLNQVLLRFHDDDAATRHVIAQVQAGGEAFMSGTTWEGRAAMRISVSNWQTSDADVDRTVGAILAAAGATAAAHR